MIFLDQLSNSQRVKKCSDSNESIAGGEGRVHEITKQRYLSNGFQKQHIRC